MRQCPADAISIGRVYRGNELTLGKVELPSFVRGLASPYAALSLEIEDLILPLGGYECSVVGYILSSLQCKRE